FTCTVTEQTAVWPYGEADASRRTIVDVDGIEVVEFTDPGCSWAWGTEPKLRLLEWRYGDQLTWRRVLGGLVGDQNNYVPNFDPVRAARKRITYWRGAYEH